MNNLQIEVFLTVARHLSFTKAAEELYVTQPAISRQISALEKELGVPLFERVNKKTRLTEAGCIYQKFFTDTLKEYKLIQEQTRKLQEEYKGIIRLGCLEGWDITGFFPEVLETFKTAYPNVEIQLECYGIRDLVNALKNDRIDAAMSIDVTLADIEETYIEELTSIPRIILFSKKHPLGQMEYVSPKDFKNETFFVMSEQEASYAADLVREYMRPFGFEPKIRTVRNIESMNACVQNGMGVEISDWWSLAKDRPDFRHIPIGSRHPIVLVWKKNNPNEAIRILSNELKFTLKQQLE